MYVPYIYIVFLKLLKKYSTLSKIKFMINVTTSFLSYKLPIF